MPLAPSELNATNLEKAKNSLAVVREQYPEMPPANLEKLQNNISLQETVLFEYAYTIAETHLDKISCERASALFEKIPDGRENAFSRLTPEARAIYIDTLSDVFFALSDCYIDAGMYEEAIDVLRVPIAYFPEKREAATEKISEITSVQEAVKKANQEPPSAAVEPSIENAE
jgi:hypothetical protein